MSSVIVSGDARAWGRVRRTFLAPLGVARAGMGWVAC